MYIGSWGKRVIMIGGDAIKRRELERKLRKGGWKIHAGGKHGMAKHPDKPGIKVFTTF